MFFNRMKEMKHTGTYISSMLNDEGRSFRYAPFLGLSLLYSCGVRFRNDLYDREVLKAHRLPCPVISVGNITAGGTGKTPTVIMLAEMLRDRGYKPAVVSRGYKGTYRGTVMTVSDGEAVRTSAERSGDEPALIARKLPGVPVIIGKKRVHAGRHAVERFGADLIILDDGFQHRSLHRDIDILLMDGVRPLGNGFLLPRGLLREGADSMKRAAILVETNGGSPSPAVASLRERFCPRTPFFQARRKPHGIAGGASREEFPLEHLRDRRVFAFAGIARPEGFQNSLQHLCRGIAGFRAYSDHHRYTEEDVRDIREAFRSSGADLILTTEKDGIKLVDFTDFVRDIFTLEIRMEVVPSITDFEETILSTLKR